jgi:hypothetical protein
MAAEVAGIVVAPTAVYLTSARPAGAVTLYNPSDVPEEVSVSTLFGYPATNENGELRLFTEEDSDDPRSAAGWIQALPQRLVVPPGERRTVRLLARPASDLPDGEYWTRLVFESRGQTLPVAGGDTTAIAIGLNLNVRTVISAAFRKGQVDTGVQIEDFTPRVQGDSLIVRPNFVRQGNAAFIGRMQVQLVSAAGELARAWEEQVAVYREYNRRYVYDLTGLPAGTYQFQIRLSTEREDIQPQHRLPAAPAVATAEVNLR